jgi:hypothetical protein
MLLLKKITYLTLSFTLFLTGCALKQPTPIVYEAPPEPPKPEWNMSTCQQTNWYEFGFSQGKDNEEEVEIDQIAAECVENGVSINTTEYLRGLEAQAKAYCTPTQGQQLGTQGQAYPKLCIPEVYSAFYFEWYRATQQYCRSQTMTMLVPPVCNELKSS